VTKDCTLSPAATADLEVYRDTWRELILIDAEGQHGSIRYKHEEADMEPLIAQGTCVPEAEFWYSDEAAETKTCLVEWAGKHSGHPNSEKRQSDHQLQTRKWMLRFSTGTSFEETTTLCTLGCS
jgi:hypothetical protein